MKKILKIVGFLVLSSPVYAVDLLKTEDSSFSFGGRVAIGGSNTDSVNNSKNLLNLVDGGSRINFTGTQKIAEGVNVGGFMEWGANTQAASSDKGNFINNRYAYAFIESENFGTIKFGKILSIVNDTVFGATVDNLYIGTNDAGATSFTGGESSDVGMTKLRSAIVYDKRIGKVHLGLQYQGKSAADFEKAKFKGQLEHRYGAGATVAYEGDMLYVAAGYTHSGNANKEGSAIDFKSSVIDTNAYIGSAGLTIDAFKVSAAGGYYQNYNVIGQSHVGAGFYAEYTLNKITPYLGFDFAYGLDPEGAVKKVGADLYGMNDRSNQVNHTLDRQNLAIGAIYKATNSLYLIAEYNYDLRSKASRESSAINPNQAKDLSLLVRYNF